MYEHPPNLNELAWADEKTVTVRGKKTRDKSSGWDSNPSPTKSRWAPFLSYQVHTNGPERYTARPDGPLGLVARRRVDVDYKGQGQLFEEGSDEAAYCYWVAVPS